METQDQKTDLASARAVVDAARKALEAAEQEHRGALARVEVARSELGEASDAYDAKPDEHNGRAVLHAREAFELAQLRADKAKSREDAARAAVEVALVPVTRLEAWASMVAARAAVDAVAAAVSSAEREAAAARTGATALSMGLALLEEAGRAQAAAAALVDEHRRTRVAAVEAATAAEDRYAQHDPDFAAALPAWRELGATWERDRLERLAGADQYRADTAADVAVIVSAFGAILAAAERIEAKYLVAQVAANDARAAGSQISPLAPAHRFVHVLRALPKVWPEGPARERVELLARRVVSQTLGGSQSQPGIDRERWHASSVLNALYGAVEAGAGYVNAPSPHDHPPELVEAFAAVATWREGAPLREAWEQGRQPTAEESAGLCERAQLYQAQVAERAPVAFRH